jgi:hypothetical protein
MLSASLYDATDCNFSTEIVMLIMRMYALYERSRKVLALYIVVDVFFIVVGCVSLDLVGMSTQRDTPLLILFCIVGAVGRKKRRTSGRENAHWLRCNFERRSVCTFAVTRVQVYEIQTLSISSSSAIRESC